MLEEVLKVLHDQVLIQQTFKLSINDENHAALQNVVLTQIAVDLITIFPVKELWRKSLLIANYAYLILLFKLLFLVYY